MTWRIHKSFEATSFSSITRKCAKTTNHQQLLTLGVILKTTRDGSLVILLTQKKLQYLLLPDTRLTNTLSNRKIIKNEQKPTTWRTHLKMTNRPNTLSKTKNPNEQSKRNLRRHQITRSVSWVLHYNSTRSTRCCAYESVSRKPSASLIRVQSKTHSQKPNFIPSSEPTQPHSFKNSLPQSSRYKLPTEI